MKDKILLLTALDGFVEESYAFILWQDIILGVVNFNGVSSCFDLFGEWTSIRALYLKFKKARKRNTYSDECINVLLAPISQVHPDRGEEDVGWEYRNGFRRVEFWSFP